MTPVSLDCGCVVFVSWLSARKGMEVNHTCRGYTGIGRHGERVCKIVGLP